MHTGTRTEKMICVSKYVHAGTQTEAMICVSKYEHTGTQTEAMTDEKEMRCLEVSAHGHANRGDER